MSYILDALKRADAERERGHVPGLHSQSPSALAPTPERTVRKSRGPALMTGAAVLLMVSAAVFWWVLWAPGAEQAPPTAVLSPMPEPTSVAQPTAMPDTPPPPPAAALPILAPAPVAASAPTAPQAGARAGSISPAAPTTGNGNGNGNVRSFAELPPDIRAQLPQVSVSGSTYSSNPAHRMLIVNGKVVREGEEIEPGLKLETMGPGKAVLNHRGTRYSIGY